MLSRRLFVSSPLLLASAAGRAMAAAGKPQLALNTGMSVRLLKLAQQLGLEWVDLGARPLGLIPPPGQPPRGTATAFTTASLGELKKQVAAHGLKIGIMPLHPVAECAARQQGPQPRHPGRAPIHPGGRTGRHSRVGVQLDAVTSVRRLF